MRPFFLACALLFVSIAPLHAQDSASVPSPISETERAVLGALTPAQLDAYLDGAPPESLRLADGTTLRDLLDARGVTNFSISWFTVDSGGGSSAGGDFQVSGTIGQLDAGASTGSDFVLRGGFWASSSPCSTSIAVFCDGFESGDVSRWGSN